MPAYEFSCMQCGRHFEKNIAFHEGRQNVRCPNGHGEVRQVYSAPWVIFKGSGWYSTDNRPPSANK